MNVNDTPQPTPSTDDAQARALAERARLDPSFGKPAPQRWYERKGLRIALLVFGLLNSVWLLRGCFFAAKADNPKEAMTMYLDAWFEKDKSTLADLTCEKEGSDGEVAGPAEGSRGDYKVESVHKLSDNEAMVTVVYAPKFEETKASAIPVVKEDGSWKVCDPED